MSGGEPETVEGRKGLPALSGLRALAVTRARGLASRGKAALEGVRARESKALETRFAGFLARSVILEEMGPPRSVQMVIGGVLAAVAAFFLWASFSQLEEATVAAGEIMPQSFLQPVQHLEGGIVGAVLVHEGQQVGKGQVLVRLNGTMTKAERDALKVRYVGLAMQAERLRAFALKEKPDFSSFEKMYPKIAADQKKILETQISTRMAQIAVARAQAAQQRKILTGLELASVAGQKQVDAIAEQARMRKELLDKGLTSRVQYLETQRALEREKASLADVISRTEATRSAILEADSHVMEVEDRLRSDALQEMGRVGAERDQAAEELRKLDDRVDRTLVRAPAAGKVKGLAVHSPGTVLPPGTKIADIVPQNDHLVAKVRISPRDIGHVRAGAEAFVKVDTFSFSRYGGIPGHVTQVSASSFKDDAGQIYFEAYVELDKTYVGPDSRSNRVTPGMTVSADIKTGTKSLLGYLVRPVYASLSDSFGER